MDYGGINRVETLIQAKQLSKSYGKFHALNDVNFVLEPGQILGLLGHNGAGKSSLINAILGVHDIKGELVVLGCEPRKDRVEIVRHLAYLSDAAILPGWMKVSQLIDYVAGLHPGFKRNKVEEYLKETDIGVKMQVARLSKGMKLQLHLALIMATDVKVLILDEPTLGLDLMYRERFYQNVVKWFHAGKRSVVIASHDVDDISHLLTHVLMLKRGRVIETGELPAVVSRYAKVSCPREKRSQLLAAEPLHIKEETETLQGIFRLEDKEQLAQIGSVSSVSLVELFVALQQEQE